MQDREDRRRALLAGTLLLLLAASACRTPPTVPRFGSSDLPILDADDIFAPAGNSISVEISRIRSGMAEGPRNHAADLRLAVLHSRLGEHGHAEAAIQRVLHAPVPPGPRAEGLAWLVRARMEWRDGRRQGAVDALRKAGQLATDPITRRHVAAAEIDFGLRERPAVTTPPKKSPATRHETRPVVLLRRRKWGSLKPNPSAMVPMDRPSRITVHHSAMYLDGTVSQAARQVRSIQRGHLRRGWGDIGYHFLVDPRGHVFEGRSLRYQGAHAGDQRSNRANIGICLLGNFQPYTREPTQRPNPVQVQGLDSLIRFCCEQYGITSQRIYTHKEVHPRGPGATLCPGAHLIPIVRRLRNRLREHPVASR